MGSEIRRTNHLKYGQMAARHYVKNQLKYKKFPDFEWSSLQMVGTELLIGSYPPVSLPSCFLWIGGPDHTAIAVDLDQPFENQIIRNLIFKKSGSQM